MHRLLLFFRRLHERSNLFQKVLIANALILIVGAVAGTWLTVRLTIKEDYHFSVHVVFTALGIYVSVLVNYLLLRVAFQPLFVLRKTMEHVREGDFSARAPRITADPDIGKLAQTFNLMLDRLERHRRSVSRQILRALEEERKRISRELHDESGQSLTTLVILLERILGRLPAESPDPATRKLRSQLEAARDLAVQTLEEIRKLMHDLRPTILDDLGLIPALRWYVKNKLKPLGYEVRLETDLEERLPDHVETTLFRIVQEALTNIIKHADASRVKIKLTGDTEFITAEIVDNGRGFDVQQVLAADPQERGLGLFGMYERADLIGGQVKISSTPGAGTKIMVKIPRGWKE